MLSFLLLYRNSRAHGSLGPNPARARLPENKLNKDGPWQASCRAQPARWAESYATIILQQALSSTQVSEAKS
jgi:hypothetical protein